ncbi:MAG: hypothetical protein LAT64_14160 [Phycisphaerales bacterium]|nr:hypothetical protein [Planctomycetota bacterium]MCH8509895.1 hypothetical protein [Phycisphaerales bacterium]
MQVGTGAAGVLLGAERGSIATRFRGRYQEFMKTPASASPTGVIDQSIFVFYDTHDRVEYIEVAEPQELMGTDGQPIPLAFGALMRWLESIPFFIDERSVCVVPSLSLALTFELDEDGRLAHDSGVTIASIGVPGYFDDV